MSKYDCLKIIKHLQESWADIGLGIFSRHKSMEGKLPPEQKHMEEIVKSTGRLYKEFEIRINGDNGKEKKTMIMIMRWLDNRKHFNSNYYFQYN